MEFTEYQEKAISLAIYLDMVTEKYPDLPNEIIKVLGLSYACLGLGEVGELQGKIKKIIRDSGASLDDEKKEELAKELGDVLWYVAACCKELGISMDYVAQRNLEKLFSRKERGVLKGSGDNR